MILNTFQPKTTVFCVRPSPLGGPSSGDADADSDVDAASEGSVKTPATVLIALTKELEVGVGAKFASVAEFRRCVAMKKEGMINPVVCDAAVKLTAEETDHGSKSTRGEEEAFLEGAILLEEFCKELSSLVLVKDQLLSAKNS